MRKLIAPIIAVLAATLVCSAGAIAEGDLSKQEPITIRVDLGKAGVDIHQFYPDKLAFETGKLYRLVLHNPSNSKHYFTSLDFANSVWTRKVQVIDGVGPDAEQIGEIKGAIREIEVYSGGTTEWWFVPVAAGTITDLHCQIKDQSGATHAEMGMTGTITIM